MSQRTDVVPIAPPPALVPLSPRVLGPVAGPGERLKHVLRAGERARENKNTGSACPLLDSHMPPVDRSTQRTP